MARGLRARVDFARDRPPALHEETGRVGALGTIATPACIPVSIGFTGHAVERYGERVRPGTSHEHSSGQLQRMAEWADSRPARPIWLEHRTREVGLLYLGIGDVVFPLVPDSDVPNRWWAVTCLVRGEISTFARARRTADRRTRRRRRRSPRPRWLHESASSGHIRDTFPAIAFRPQQQKMVVSSYFLMPEEGLEPPTRGL